MRCNCCGTPFPTTPAFPYTCPDCGAIYIAAAPGTLAPVQPHTHPRPLFTPFGLMGFIIACVLGVLVAVFVPILWHGQNVLETMQVAQGGQIVNHEGRIASGEATAQGLVRVTQNMDIKLTNLGGRMGAVENRMTAAEGELKTLAQRQAWYNSRLGRAEVVSNEAKDGLAALKAKYDALQNQPATPQPIILERNAQP